MFINTSIGDNNNGCSGSSDASWRPIDKAKRKNIWKTLLDNMTRTPGARTRTSHITYCYFRSLKQYQLYQKLQKSLKLQVPLDTAWEVLVDMDFDIYLSPFFIGPMCTWGSIIGSPCLSLCLYVTFLKPCEDCQCCQCVDTLVDDPGEDLN